MRVTYASDEHGYRVSRTLNITDLPDNPSGLRELQVTINYTQEPNDVGRATKAVALDGTVIPAIIAALNGEEDTKQ